MSLHYKILKTGAYVRQWGVHSKVGEIVQVLMEMTTLSLLLLLL